MIYENEQFSGTHAQWAKRLDASLPSDNPAGWPMPAGEKPPVKVQPEHVVYVPTIEQLLYSLEEARKAAEDQGVIINGIRYSGSQGNRQALAEALQAAEEYALTEFATWKDSGSVYHQNVPVADVHEALRAIGLRRMNLIAQEGVYAQQIQSGEITTYAEIEALVWTA